MFGKIICEHTVKVVISLCMLIAVAISGYGIGCEEFSFTSSIQGEQNICAKEICVTMSLTAVDVHGGELWIIDWGDGEVYREINRTRDRSTLTKTHCYTEPGCYNAVLMNTPSHIRCAGEQRVCFGTFGIQGKLACDGGTTNIDYQVVDPNGTATFKWSTGATTEDLIGVGPGMYTVTVTDGACTVIDTVEVTPTEGPQVQLEVDTTILCSGSGGSAQTIVTGDPANNPLIRFKEDFEDDSNGTVQGPGQPPLWSVTINPPRSQYNVFEVQGHMFTDGYGGTGENEVRWRTKCIDISGCTNPKLKLDLARLGQTNGCSGRDFLEIQWRVDGGALMQQIPTPVNWLPDWTHLEYNIPEGNCVEIIIGHKASCLYLPATTYFYDNITVECESSTGTPGYTYEWSTGATTPGVTGLGPGKHTVTVTDDNGCRSEAELEIPEKECGMAVSLNGGEACVGECVSIEALPLGGQEPISYSWSDAALSGPGPHNVCPAATTIYSVTATDVNGLSASDSSVVTINDLPVLTTSGTDASCDSCDGSVNVSISGNGPPYAYNWSPVQGSGSTLSGLCEGTYEVTVTDTNNCVSNTAVSIGKELCGFIVSVNSNEYCGEGCTDIVVTIEGGEYQEPLTYEWSGITPDPGSPGAFQICTNESQNYTVTVTDANGQTDTARGNILVHSLPIASLTKTDTRCGLCVGSANVAVTPGSPPYTYRWDDGQTTGTIQDLCPGVYQLTVTDSLGCSGTTQATITTTDGPQVSATATNVTCEYPCSGTATAIVDVPSSPPYTYRWNDPDGQQTETATGLCEGEYTVTLTDADGCSAVARTRVTAGTDPACEFEVWFPNVFTPDDATKNNHRARVRGQGIVELEIRIFDRWGELVYYSEDIDEAVRNGWDGNFKGEPVDVDTYAWYIIARTSCCSAEDTKIFQKGSLTVLR